MRTYIQKTMDEINNEALVFPKNDQILIELFYLAELLTQMRNF